MVGPLRGESGLIGSLVVANRLTEGTTFTDDDLRLLETLANQAAVALENGQLEQSLAELSRLKEQLRYQAYHDPLTGLANRSLFAGAGQRRALAGTEPDRVPSSCSSTSTTSRSSTTPWATPAGDRLLIAGRRARPGVRPDRRPGRPPRRRRVRDPARRRAPTWRASRGRRRRGSSTRSQVTFPIDGPGDQDLARASASRRGLGDRDRADELLRNADVAMYTAKAGRQEPVRRLRADDARGDRGPARACRPSCPSAVDGGELVVYYQPIVASRPASTYGVEALVRWRHPTRGLRRARRVHPAGRGERGDPRPRPLGAVRGLPRGGAAGGATGRRAIVLTVNLSAAAARSSRPSSTTSRRSSRATGLPADATRPRDDRDRRCSTTPRRRSRASQALRDLGVRIADRRLRDRLLVARLPAPLPGRHPQDRPRVHRPPRTAGPRTGRSPARSSRSAGRSACGSSPRGSRRPASSTSLRELGCEFGPGLPVRAGRCRRRGDRRRGSGRRRVRTRPGAPPRPPSRAALPAALSHEPA